MRWPSKTKKPKASKYKVCLVFFCKLKIHFYGLERTILFSFGFFFPLILNVMENYLNYLFSTLHRSYLFDVCRPLFLESTIIIVYLHPLCFMYLKYVGWVSDSEIPVLFCILPRTLYFGMALSFASWWCYQVQLCSIKNNSNVTISLSYSAFIMMDSDGKLSLC